MRGALSESGLGYGSGAGPATGPRPALVRRRHDTTRQGPHRRPPAPKTAWRREGVGAMPRPGGDGAADRHEQNAHGKVIRRRHTGGPQPPARANARRRPTSARRPSTHTVLPHPSSSVRRRRCAAGPARSGRGHAAARDCLSGPEATMDGVPPSLLQLPDESLTDRCHTRTNPPSVCQSTVDAPRRDSPTRGARRRSVAIPGGAQRPYVSRPRRARPS